MPRKYKRKSNRGAEEDVLQRAREQVREGSSIRAAAKDFNIARMTLKRYIDKANARNVEQSSETFCYKNCRLKNLIFSQEMETDLASHIKTLAQQFHGLSRNKCRSLIVEYALRNKVTVPDSWREIKLTGEHFWISFKERNHLSIRTPEATSLARATAFNRYNVGQFYDNLGIAMDLDKFECQDIYNTDETGCSTVSPPENVVAEQGVRQVGSITSAERGQLVTSVYAVNAAGTVVPPMLIFPRKNVRDHFTKSGPPGCIGGANPSGWINEDLFVDYLNHSIPYHTRCSKEKKVLLILDNHETHISLRAIDTAKENGVVLLTIPPHTSHKLQPLDVSCYKPFKTAYARAVENWMRSNQGKTITIYEIPEFVAHAQLHGLTAKNVISGFHSTGICPYNRDVFNETDFAPATVTDRDIPEDLNGMLGPAEAVMQPVPPATHPELNPPGPLATQPGPGPSGSPATQPGPSGSPATQPGPSGSPATHPGPGPSGPPATQPGPSPLGPPATQPGSSPLQQPATQPGPSSAYVSPADIIPLPKAGPRKVTNRGRKRWATQILTSTPVRNSIALAKQTKKQRSKQPVKPRAKKSLFKTKERKSPTPSTSSGESDSEDDVVLAESGDSDKDDDIDYAVIEGDFAVVKFQTAKSCALHSQD